MAWNEAWEANTVYIGGHDMVNDVDLPSVKHLLADVCNAIQERYRYRFDSQYFWKLADKTLAIDVEPNDFKGAIVNRIGAAFDYYAVSELCNDVVENLKSLFDGYNTTNREGFYTDDTFSTGLTFADAVSNAGLLTQEQLEEKDELDNIKNWRDRRWWDTLRAVLEQAKFVEIRCKIENGDLTIDRCGFVDTGTYASLNMTRQDLWDTSVFTNVDTFTGGIGYRFTGSYIYDKFDGTNEEWLWGGGSASLSDLTLKYLYEKRPNREFSWDSDYKRSGSSWVLRSFPIPKAAHNGKVPVRLDPFWALWWASGTNMVAVPDHESTEPVPTDFSLDVSVFGEDATVTYDEWLDSSSQPSGDWVIGTADPDGTDDFVCDLPTTAPAVICEDGYVPDTYDATPPTNAGRVYFGSELPNGHYTDGGRIEVSIGRLNAQFNLESVLDYP
jgi:hypothetical protein